MLEVELEDLEEDYRVYLSRSRNKKSLVAPMFVRKASSFGTILELLRSNAHMLHSCRMCSKPFIGSASKLYCSSKCRVMAYRKL